MSEHSVIKVATHLLDLISCLSIHCLSWHIGSAFHLADLCNSKGHLSIHKQNSRFFCCVSVFSVRIQG